MNFNDAERAMQAYGAIRGHRYKLKELAEVKKNTTCIIIEFRELHTKLDTVQFGLDTAPAIAAFAMLETQHKLEIAKACRTLRQLGFEVPDSEKETPKAFLR